MNDAGCRHRHDLERIARRAMVERDLEPEFSPAALHEVAALRAAAVPPDASVRDLRTLPWCSIDNDDSRDLDQLSVGEDLGKDGVRIRVAVADVDALVARGSAVDAHARANTTSVYTPARIFPMLPERLSTDLTSLNPGVDRVAMVIDMVVGGDGTVGAAEVYHAHVHNRAKLAYNATAAWLEDQGPMPAPIAAVPGLDANLRLQDLVAQQLRARRHEQGALDLETVQVRTVFDGDRVMNLAPDEKNRAKELIEDFMVAANGVTARFLAAHGMASIRRVVRSPERWARIQELAVGYHEKLPPEADAEALAGFLARRRVADPLRFPDLSLAVIKLMGRGEYVVERPQQDATGHFGLAVRDYTHSTAPNRRFPDLITQRLVKAALAAASGGGSPRAPYPPAELEALAAHCTQKEDDASKVERLVRKAAAACVLASRIGEEFEGLVTGASDKGTWARIFDPPVEGRIEQGAQGLDVGDRVRVRLVSTDIERGWIDFARVGPGSGNHRDASSHRRGGGRR